jgi:hypothetical protein
VYKIYQIVVYFRKILSLIGFKTSQMSWKGLIVGIGVYFPVFSKLFCLSISLHDLKTNFSLLVRLFFGFLSSCHFTVCHCPSSSKMSRNGFLFFSWRPLITWHFLSGTVHSHRVWLLVFLKIILKICFNW